MSSAPIASARHNAGVTSSRSLRRASQLVVLAVALGFPLLASSLWLSVVIAVMVAIPGALALNLLTGVAGLISIGNAAFMAIGALVAGELGARHGWPFPLVVLAAGCVSAAIGALVGAPSLRLRGIYLLVSTMALQFLAVFAFREVEIRSVGESGFQMPAPGLFGVSVATPVAWYFMLLVVGVICFLGYVNLMRTGSGRSWLLVRERDLAAAVVGIDVARAKIMVFTVSSFAIGIQGALFAYYVQVVSYEAFTIDLATSYVAMILIGGMGSPVGSVLGAAFVVGLPYVLQELSLKLFVDWSWFGEHLVDLQNLVYGLSVIGFLLFEPKGLVAVFGKVGRWFRAPGRTAPETPRP